MAITLQCPCGKTLNVKDEMAGKRIKCPVCGTVQAAPAPVVRVKILEAASTTSSAVAPKTDAVDSAMAPLTAADVEVIDDDPSPAAPGASPARRAEKSNRKKKKAKQRELSREEKVNRDYEQWKEDTEREKRITIGVCFLGGGIILTGFAIYLLVAAQDVVNPIYSIIFIVFGLMAVATGVLGLLFGSHMFDLFNQDG